MRDPAPWGTKRKRKTWGRGGVWHWMLLHRPSSTGPSVGQLPLVYFSMRNELLLPTVASIGPATLLATRHRPKPCFGILCYFTSDPLPPVPFDPASQQARGYFCPSSAQLCCPRSITGGRRRKRNRDGRHKRLSMGLGSGWLGKFDLT